MSWRVRRRRRRARHERVRRDEDEEHTAHDIASGHLPNADKLRTGSAADDVSRLITCVLCDVPRRRGAGTATAGAGRRVLEAATGDASCAVLQTRRSPRPRPLGAVQGAAQRGTQRGSALRAEFVASPTNLFQIRWRLGAFFREHRGLTSPHQAAEKLKTAHRVCISFLSPC